jgi:4-amino-4-deoxy-L-arabinose transferase
MQKVGDDWLRRTAYGVGAMLLLIFLLLGFGFQGSRGIWQPDEGYYVSTAVTMLARGELLIPYLGEEVFLDKPPMMYWGIIGGIKLFGHNEFGARAFNALCFLGTILTVGFLGSCLFRTKRDAVAASFIYATMVLPFGAANFVTADTPLVLWTTLAALFFWKSVDPRERRTIGWKLLLCGSIGLGFLAKGPAALIPCEGMFVFLAVRCQATRYFLTPLAVLGVLIFCAVGLGWYMYVALEVSGAASYFIDNEVWGRLVSDKYNRNPGVTGALIYVPVLVFGSLPWSAIWWERREQITTTYSINHGGRSCLTAR